MHSLHAICTTPIDLWNGHWTIRFAFHSFVFSLFVLFVVFFFLCFCSLVLFDAALDGYNESTENMHRQSVWRRQRPCPLEWDLLNVPSLDMVSIIIILEMIVFKFIRALRSNDDDNGNDTIYLRIDKSKSKLHESSMGKISPAHTTCLWVSAFCSTFLHAAKHQLQRTHTRMGKLLLTQQKTLIESYRQSFTFVFVSCYRYVAIIRKRCWNVVTTNIPLIHPKYKMTNWTIQSPAWEQLLQSPSEWDRETKPENVCAITIFFFFTELTSLTATMLTYRSKNCVKWPSQCDRCLVDAWDSSHIDGTLQKTRIKQKSDNHIIAETIFPRRIIK